MSQKATFLIVFILLFWLLAGQAFAQVISQPTRAMLYSAAVPGGGQLYNREWIKAGVVMGVQGWLIGSAIHNKHQKSRYHDLYVSDQSPWHKSQEEEYRKRLNNDIWWIGITAALSMVDAFVDAHLADFETQQKDLQLRFTSSGVKLQYRY